MKKILLSLATLLMAGGAWAQTVVTTINVDKFYTLECKSASGHLTTRFIADNGTVINGQSAMGTYFEFESAEAENQYYIKSTVSGRYLNSDGANMSTSTAEKTAWTLNAPSHSPNTVSFTCGSDKYLNNNGTSCEDGTCQNLKPNGHAGGPTAGNACSLWTLTEYDEATPSVTFTYNYKYNDAVVLEEEVFAYVGDAYPALTKLPVGIEASLPQGNVTEDLDGTDVDVVCTISNCPIEFAQNATSITKWYYLRVHSNRSIHIQYLADQDYIEWVDTSFPADEIDSHLWGFVGSPFGVQVINKNAAKGIVSTGADAATIGAEPTAFFMAKGKGTDAGKFCLQHTSGNYLNGQNSNTTGNVGKLWHWNENDAGSDFIPVEYTNTEVEVSLSKYATLCLPYQSYIPEGVKAYIVSNTSATSATLQEVTGIIPANAGVILENTGKFSFKTAVGTAADVAGNMLVGTNEETTVTKEDGSSYYVLANKGNVVGFYQAVDGDNENQFINAAGKAYLKVTEEAEAARFLTFDFGTETAIESIQGAESANAVVYDLAGRRVQGAQKGLYIVNGKKVIK